MRASERACGQVLPTVFVRQSIGLLGRSNNDRWSYVRQLGISSGRFSEVVVEGHTGRRGKRICFQLGEEHSAEPDVPEAEAGNGRGTAALDRPPIARLSDAVHEGGGSGGRLSSELRSLVCTSNKQARARGPKRRPRP